MSDRSLLAAAAATICVLTSALLEAQGSEAGSAGWKTYRNESGDYEFTYPGTMSLSVPKGETCSGGKCKATEQVMLSGCEGAKGGLMSFVIQRGINPEHLAIRQWYESLAHRPLDKASEILTSVGGKPAIHRGPLIEGVSAQSDQGKIVSSRKAMLPDDTTFLAINASDVLSISINSTGTKRSEVCARVLSTITILR